MAQPSNSFSTYDAVGNREDLSDVIYNVAPHETPFISMIGKVKATSTKHEWQTDTLDSPSGSNAVIDGDDATTDAITATVRKYNYMQISDKVARVTGSQQAVDKAGRKDELAYAVVNKAKALRTDMETVLLQNVAAVAGDDTTARKTAGFPTWMVTNTSFGTGGAVATGDGTDTFTEGTARAFTESLLQTVLQSCWENGGSPDCIMVGGFNKKKFSTFTGNATRFKTAEDKKLVATIDIYDSDWGELMVVPNRLQDLSMAYVIQKDMWALAQLRAPRIASLAKTGDSERKQIIVEYGLEARNEKSSGLIAGLSTS